MAIIEGDLNPYSNQDDLYGSSSDDTFYGYTGNDILRAGSVSSYDGHPQFGGNDTLYGGSGDDTYHVDDNSDVVIELASEGTDTVNAYGASYTLTDHVENLWLFANNDISSYTTTTGTGNSLNNVITGANQYQLYTLSGLGGDDTLHGNQNNDTLYGGTGTNILNGNDGDDNLYSDLNGTSTMTGGNGDDAYHIYHQNDTIVEAVSSGARDHIYAYDTNFNLEGYNINYLTLAVSQGSSAQNVNAYGRATEADVIYGNDANNSLYGYGGADVLYGGAGNDTLYNSNDTTSTDADQMYGGAGDDVYIIRGNAFVTEFDLNNFQNGAYQDAGGNDTIYFYGGPTNSGYSGLAIGDYIETTYIYSSTNTEVQGSNQDNSITGGTGIINRLFGRDGNDILGGRELNDILDGGDGNDYLYGAAGDDTMTGGDGNDRYQVDVVGDTVTENTNEGTDTVEASIDYTLGDNVENLTLQGTAINGTGNSLANTIVGNAENNTLNGDAGEDSLSGGDGNDTLNGGTGADYMAGGNGDDTYYVDNFNETVYEADGAGTDSVIAESSFSLNTAAYAENLTLTGSSDLNGYGNSQANTITGNDGNNTLEGHGGNDTIYGGGGVDLLNGGAGNDILIAGDGNDILYGYSGNDAMTGGTGNDLYYVDDAGDTITENAGEGTDWIYATATHTMSANVEVLAMHGTSDINATGNSSDNSMIGNSGNNTIDGAGGNDSISGGGGNDTLTGGDGNDNLRGGTGDDILIGGDGNDTYRFTDINFGAETITDSSGTNDLIDTGIFSVFDVDSWQAIDTNADTFVDQLFLDFGSGNTITINNYFDNTSASDNLSGAGTGATEYIVFYDNWIDFSEVQYFAA